MPAKPSNSAVARNEDGSWTYQCPGVDSQPCGDPGSGQPFVSVGWPTRAIAQKRGAQHLDEHNGNGPTPSLEEFRAEHGLTSHNDGIRAVQIGDQP